MDGHGLLYDEAVLDELAHGLTTVRIAYLVGLKGIELDLV